MLRLSWRSGVSSVAKILIVDDDADHIKMVSAYLSREHYVVESAIDGRTAQDILSVSEYDVIVLDWELPDTTGIDLLKWYRARGNAPVIMLTGKASISHRETGLDSGADDYLIKPFSAKELCARIRALLRRPPTFSGTELTLAGYTLSPPTLMVTKGDRQVRLAPREFALLEFFARHQNEIFEADMLMKRVWKADNEATTDSLRTAIKLIRRKLDEGIIETVKGAGYKAGSGGDSA